MLFWVAPISALIFKWDLPFLIKKYILCVDPSQLWFLWMLFIVFLMAWIFKKFLISTPVLGWFIVAVFYFIGLISMRIIPNYFCIWTACQYFPFFYIGVRIRVREENSENISGRLPFYSWIFFHLLLFLIVMILKPYNGVFFRMIFFVMNLLLHFIGAMMAWITLQTIASKINWRESGTFKNLSLYSMPMYLFHQQIIYFVIMLLNGHVNPWINAAINFLVALIGSFIISRILMRWNLGRILIGEK